MYYRHISNRGKNKTASVAAAGEGRRTKITRGPPRPTQYPPSDEQTHEQTKKTRLISERTRPCHCRRLQSSPSLSLPALSLISLPSPPVPAGPRCGSVGQPDVAEVPGDPGHALDAALFSLDVGLGSGLRRRLLGALRGLGRAQHQRTHRPRTADPRRTRDSPKQRRQRR